MPVAAVDGIGHIVRYVNPAFCLLAGKLKKELLGKPFTSMPGGDECLAMLDRVYRTGKAETHMGQDGAAEHPFYWSYAMSPILGEGDHSLGIFIRVTEATSFHQDCIAMNQALLIGSLRQHELTEQANGLNAQLQAEISGGRQTQEALVRSEKLASVGRMAAVMAYEINNPLDAIMNTLYLVESTEGLPESARHYLKIAEGELNRIAHITRQTLGFYRESTHPTTFCLAPLLDSVLDLLQAKIKNKQAIVEKRCDERLQVTGIFGELRQVFANLVLNSLDAIEMHGSVKLAAIVSSRCGGSDRCVRVSVGDNGKGIDPATLPHLFEPFFTTKGDTGNGLGLWVSQQIIAKHTGSIQVRSSRDGRRKGTVFTVILPVEPGLSDR